MTYNPNASGVPALSRSNSRSSTNSTGSTLIKGTPVRLSATGMALIDVSSETEVDSVAGVLRSDVINGAQGEVISGGIIEDITTSFAIGDAVYISKTGDLTNFKPSIGVAGFTNGDFVVRVGVISKNNANPLLKDLLVSIQIMGQL